MLIRTGNIIKHSTSRTGSHDNIAHLNLQGVALQKNSLFLQGQPALLRRFIISLIIRSSLRMPGVDRKFNGSLFLRYSQTGYQLLIDL